MNQNIITENPSMIFNDPTLIGNSQINILQLQFTSEELTNVDYIEIQIDGMKKSFSFIK